MKQRRVKLHSAGWMQRKADAGKQSRRASWLQHQIKKGNVNCTYCNRRVTRNAPQGHPTFATVDHIIPLSKGGYDGPRNWCIACDKCNQAKGSLTVEEWQSRLAAAPLPPAPTSPDQAPSP